MKTLYFSQDAERQVVGPWSIHDIRDKILAGRLPADAKVSTSRNGPWFAPNAVKGEWWSGVMHRQSVAGLVQVLGAWFVAAALFEVGAMVLNLPDGLLRGPLVLQNVVLAVGCFAGAEILRRLRQIAVTLQGK